MAREFYLIENYRKNGNIGISPKVFEEIASFVAREIDGVELLDDSSTLFRKSNISCKMFRNQISINMNIRIRYGFNVADVSSKLRANVSQTIFNMTELMPSKIDISIDDVR